MIEISGITAEEYFTYYCEDEVAKKHVEDLLEEQENDYEEKLDQEIYNQTESLREQIYFAQELIESIKEHADSETRMKEFKKTLNILIENSLFEF